MDLQPKEFSDEPYLANEDHQTPLVSTHEMISSRNKRRRRQRSSRSRSTGSALSALSEYWANTDPWETRSIRNSLEIKLELPTEIPSQLLPIPGLSLDEPARMPESTENMVTVDHDLSGGVISSLCPENGDTEGTTPFSTKENSYKTTCEEVDDQEVYPEKLPSAIFLEMISDEGAPTASSDLSSTNKEELQISIVDHFSPKEEEMEITLGLGPCLEQSISDLPYESSQLLPSNPPSHKPEVIAVQGWFS